MLIADAEAGNLTPPISNDPDAILSVLDSRGIDYTTWEGWHRLDAAERAAGESDTAHPRERKKIVEWEDMLGHSTHTGDA